MFCGCGVGGVWVGRGFGGVVWVGGWCVGGVGFGLGWWVVAGGGGWLAALRSCVHAPVLRPFLLSLLALVNQEGRKPSLLHLSGLFLVVLLCPSVCWGRVYP